MNILAKLQANRNAAAIERVFPRLQARYAAAINRRDVLAAELQYSRDAATRRDYAAACAEVAACESIAARLDNLDMSAIAEV